MSPANAIDLAALKNYAVSRATYYGLNPTAILQQIMVESSWNPNATSSKGAKGLMQFMPATWGDMKKHFGFSDADITDPAKNIEAGCWSMSWLLGQVKSFAPGLDGESAYALALMAYNGGIGYVEKAIKAAADKSMNGILVALQSTGIRFNDVVSYAKKIILPLGNGQKKTSGSGGWHSILLMLLLL